MKLPKLLPLDPAPLRIPQPESNPHAGNLLNHDPFFVRKEVGSIHRVMDVGAQNKYYLHA